MKWIRETIKFILLNAGFFLVGWGIAWALDMELSNVSIGKQIVGTIAIGYVWSIMVAIVAFMIFLLGVKD